MRFSCSQPGRQHRDLRVLVRKGQFAASRPFAGHRHLVALRSNHAHPEVDSVNLGAAEVMHL